MCKCTPEIRTPFCGRSGCQNLKGDRMSQSSENLAEMANQQLTGFFHCDDGYGLESLIDAMGLTEKEFRENFDEICIGLTESQINIIENVLSFQ